MTDSSTPTLWGNLRAATERGDVQRVLALLVSARAHDAFEDMRDYAQQKIPLIKDPYTWAPYVYWRRGTHRYPGNGNGWATRYNNLKSNRRYIDAPMEWLMDGEPMWSVSGDPEDQSVHTRVKRAMLTQVDVAFLKWQGKPFFEFMERNRHEDYACGQQLGRKGLQLIEQGHASLTDQETYELIMKAPNRQPLATHWDYGREEKIPIARRATAMNPEWHGQYNAFPTIPKNPEHYFLGDHAHYVGHILLYHLFELYNPSLHPLIAFPLPQVMLSLAVALAPSMDSAGQALEKDFPLRMRLEKTKDTLWDYWMALALETICPYYFTGTRQEYRESLRLLNARMENEVDTE